MWIFEYVPVITLTPRFILSLRALYARGLRGECEPRDIDSEFGFTSVSGRGVRETTMVFADARQDERLDQDEEMPMEERGIRNGSV